MLGMVPPRAARRFALSLSMRAVRPARTSAVFSFMPVSSPARSTRRSSILSVVLMHISMHHMMPSQVSSSSARPVQEERTLSLTARNSLNQASITTNLEN